MKIKVNLLPNARPGLMAKKSDTFPIRITTAKPAAIGFSQDVTDLGAYVDALGKSVLRIHTLQVVYQDTASPEKGPVADATGVTLNLGWQLTTSSQAALVLASDKSVVASGKMTVPKDSGSAIIKGVFETADLNPSDWDMGYLIATESLYLGVKNDVLMDDPVTVTVIAECSVETMDERAAMALALSQQ